MKSAKVVEVVESWKVWCERCSIRIAPNEERETSGTKVYHTSCFGKLSNDLAKAKAEK
jgi:hypothetical protein